MPLHRVLGVLGLQRGFAAWLVGGVGLSVLLYTHQEHKQYIDVLRRMSFRDCHIVPSQCVLYCIVRYSRDMYDMILSIG